MIWPGNSPDLNMIEICWAYLKRITTKKGPLISRKAAEVAWTKAWEDLEQWRIQWWVKYILYHIEQVIRLKSGNEYQERHLRILRNKKYLIVLQQERHRLIHDN